jgi:hypothetical protein
MSGERATPSVQPFSEEMEREAEVTVTRRIHYFEYSLTDRGM